MISIGVDIGGTSIKGAAVKENGQVLKTFSFPVHRDDSAEITINNLIKELKRFIPTLNEFNEDIIGIGIGCAGAINSKKGTVDYSNNLRWFNVPIVEMVYQGTGLPTKITNDANAAALGEARFGAGKLYENIVLITLGTGVGGGVVINNQLFEGNEGKGTELGHMVIKFDGEMCTCGRRGCLEAYASATALIRETKKAMEENPTSKMWELVNGDISLVDGRVAFDARKAGDDVARRVVDRYVFYLGEGILNISNIFRPEAIVFSGGVSNEGKYLLDLLYDYCHARYFGFRGSPEPKLIQAVLGYQAGMIGAAALFF